MKVLSVVAAVSLALSPALAAANGTTPSQSASAGAASEEKKPEPGPVAGRALSDSEIPAGAIVIGGLILIGGAIVGLMGSSDANNNTNGANVPAN